MNMSMSSTDHGLLTPDNCAVVFIDCQPRLFLGVASRDRQELLNNLLVLAKAAKIFAVPVLLTVLTPGFGGQIMPSLRAVFPDHTPIRHSSLSAWDNADFVAAAQMTGRRNFLLAALWSEVCLVLPALPMLEAGYGVYAVVDACGGGNPVAQAAAIRRIEQAGAVSLTAWQVLLEFQRDWARSAHYDEVLAVMREHGAACLPTHPTGATGS